MKISVKKRETKNAVKSADVLLAVENLIPKLFQAIGGMRGLMGKMAFGMGGVSVGLWLRESAVSPKVGGI